MGSGTIGRTRERSATVRELTRDAAIGDPATAVVLEGAAGMGKSVLFDAVLADVVGRGLRVLTARPSAPEARLPFAGLLDLFTGVEDEVLRGLDGPRQEALRRALLLSGPPLAGDGAGSHVSIAVLHGVTAALRGLAERGPLVVAVDGVHWLDAPTRGALAFAARRLRDDSGVRLLSTARPRGDDGDLPLDEALDGWRRHRIVLGPMSVTELGALLRQQGRALPRAAVQRLHQRCSGNPLHAEQLAAAGLTHGLDADPAGELPTAAGHGGLDDVIRTRLYRRSRECRFFLLQLSLLAKVPVGVAEQLGPGLTEALEHDLVRVRAGRVVAAHPMITALAHADASTEQRRAAHSLLAAVVTRPDERAVHLALGLSDRDGAAAERLDEAARAALARGAQSSAAELARSAARITPVDAPSHVERALRAAEYTCLEGDGPAAAAELDRLIAVLPAGPDRARARWLRSDLEPDLGAATAQARLALEDAGSDPALLSTIHSTLAVIEGMARGMDAWSEYAGYALAAAERTDDPHLLVSAIVRAGFARLFTGEGQDGGALDRADALLRLAPSVPANETPVLLRGIDAMCRGLFDEARRALREADERAARLADLPGHGSILMRRVELEVRAGRWDDAAAAVDAICEISLDSGVADWERTARYLTALLAVHRGDDATASENATAARDDAALTSDPVLWLSAEYVLGATRLLVDDPEGALRHFTGAAATAHRIRFTEPGLRPLLLAHAEALAATGRTDEAASMADHLRALLANRRDAHPWGAATVCGIDGIVAGARSDVDRATANLLEAEQAFGRMGALFDAARVAHLRGSVLRRAKRKADARTCLAEAAEAFDRLGASRWAARAASEAQRLGLRSGPAPGTREVHRRITALLGQGRSNAQIAAVLHMSPRTVEAHLTALYRQHGVHSRAALVAALGPPAEAGHAGG